METISITLGVVAATLHGVAYVMYMQQVSLGQSKPNPISWSIWAFLAVMNAASFTAMSDLVSALQFLTGTVACIAVFFYALRIGKFKWPARGAKEWKIFGLALLAAVVWYFFRSAEGANMIVLLAFLISFKPTLDGVKEDPEMETARPWWIWTLAFVMTIANLIIRDKPPIAFVMPGVLLLGHFIIGWLSREARKEAFRTREVTA